MERRAVGSGGKDSPEGSIWFPRQVASYHPRHHREKIRTPECWVAQFPKAKRRSAGSRREKHRRCGRQMLDREGELRRAMEEMMRRRMNGARKRRSNIGIVGAIRLGQSLGPE